MNWQQLKRPGKEGETRNSIKKETRLNEDDRVSSFFCSKKTYGRDVSGETQIGLLPGRER